MSLRSIIYAVAGLWLVIVSASCSNNGCTENRSAVPLARFFDSNTDKVITLDSLSVSGVDQPGDSVLSAAGKPVSEVYLPMRPTHDNVKWCFAYKWKHLDYPQFYDTIAFSYDTTPFFASEECGAYYRYRITEMSFTDHLIESVEIVDSLITNIDRVYVKIYFRVEEEEQP